MDMNIILVGFMGTGKTRVGQRVAARLDLPFIDMDAIIEEREGKPISAIFAEHGEAFFRRLERGLVRELAREGPRVIATGGGVVLNPDNVSDFENSGPVICLSAEPTTILERVAAETHRPLLESGDKLREIQSILEKRRDIYRAVRHQVDTTALDIDEVADRVIAIYREAEATR